MLLPSLANPLPRRPCQGAVKESLIPVLSCVVSGKWIPFNVVEQDLLPGMLILASPVKRACHLVAC
eukprot:6202735-Pleurochrysis_carterae.AAC.1